VVNKGTYAAFVVRPYPDRGLIFYHLSWRWFLQGKFIGK